MKKINFPGGGQPVNLTDVKDLHDEFINIFEALGAGIGACVVSGVLVSGVATDASISEGWLFLDEEFMKFSPLSGIDFIANPTQYLVPGSVIESRPKNFTVGGLKNTRSSRDAVLQTALPSGGDFIPIKFTGHNQSLPEVLGRNVLPVGSILEVDDVSSFSAATGLGSGSWRGWALCDGRNGTQAILGRVVVGYNPSDIDYNVIGKAGGAKSVSLTASQIPSHNHKMIALMSPGQKATDSLTASNQIADVGNRGNSNPSFDYAIAGTSVSASVGSSGNTGGSQSHENRQPYIVLAYVKKIA